MTRLLLILSLLASTAFGQTYVRPSKGTSFYPFSASTITVSPGPLRYTFAPQAYDWSSFDAVRVRIYSDDPGNNQTGDPCTSQTFQYTLTNFSTFIRFVVIRAGLVTPQVTVSVQDGPTAAGPWAYAAPTANYRSEFANCTIKVMVTPIAFAPNILQGIDSTTGLPAAVTVDPATGSISTTASIVVGDAGAINVNVVSSTSTPSDGGYTTGATITMAQPYQCGSVLENVFVMDAGSVSVLSTSNTRVFANVCNSAENNTGIVRCRSDGLASSLTAGTPGMVLDTGDCMLSTNPASAPLYCSGGGGLYVTVSECGPSPIAASGSGSLDSGVLFYLTMDSIDAGFKLRDSVSNTWNGTVSNGTTLAAGLISNALDFTGDGFYIKSVTGIGSFYTSPLSNTTGWTVAGWVRLNSYSPPWFGNATGGIFSDASNRGFLFDYPSHAAYVCANSGCFGSSATLALGTWTHLAMTYDGTNVRFYQNGSLVGGGAATWGTGFAFNQIGNLSNYYQFDGRIDEVVVYNRAITASEVGLLVNGGTGRTWPL